MFTEWPDIKEGPFDLIIATESFASSLHPYSADDRINALELEALLKRVIKILKPGGEFRMIDGVLRRWSGTEEVIKHIRAAFENTGVTIDVHNEILSIKNEPSPNNE